MKTISISLFLLLIIMTTAISYAAGRDTTTATETKNVAKKNLTGEKTVSKDKADKNSSEKADKKLAKDTPRKKNVLSRFFSAVKKFFGKGNKGYPNKQKANKQIKVDKSSKDTSKRNYDYFVDKDGDGICDGRHLNRRQRRQRGGHQRTRLGKKER